VLGGGCCPADSTWQKNRVPTSADELPALYHIFRAGAGVDAGVERAYGVRDF